MENLRAVIEALVFVSESPLSADRIKDILPEVEKSDVVRLLGEIARDYEERQAGIQLREIAGGFQFRTREDAGPWVKKLMGVKPALLSRAALETLAVVAYRQPVVKADVDRVRGVDTGGPLRSLLEKKMVRIVGRKDVPGKPIIYGTTKKFLEVFNLKDLAELPTLRELKDLQDDALGNGIGIDSNSGIITDSDSISGMITDSDSESDISISIDSDSNASARETDCD